MSDSDSDAPEEFTLEEALKQDQEISKVQKQSKVRVAREGKERRRKWAQRLTPRPPKAEETKQDVMETETEREPSASAGMLPNDIVQLLAAREKKVFLSDSEDEKVEAKPPRPRKKKHKISGMETVILKDISPPQCLQNSLEFLKKKKMEVSRSTSVLNNSNQALRLISSSGLLSKK